MVASIEMGALQNYRCSKAYGKIAVGVDNTCDLEQGCERAGQYAFSSLWNRIRKEYPNCQSYVRLIENSCVQYTSMCP